MATITQKQLDDFKNLYPSDPVIKDLTLEEILKNSNGGVNWETIQFPSTNNSVNSLRAKSLALTDCQLNIGYVIFDAICLGVGAVGLRATVSGTTIEAIFHAAAPAMAKIELVIAEMAREGASAKDFAIGVFNILKTLYSGGCLGAVFSAFTASLTWWDMILYGISGTATIVAAFATDGLAFVAEIVILLATFGFLASDSIKAYQVCSLPAPGQFTDGMRIRNEISQRIYLAIDGALRWIPDPATYFNLFPDWTGVINVPNTDNYLVGEDITEGASLVGGTPDGKKFLLLEEGKRWITSPQVFNKYGFGWNLVKTIPAADLTAIPTGDPIN
jgi:hypothetical protein